MTQQLPPRALDVLACLPVYANGAVEPYGARIEDIAADVLDDPLFASQSAAAGKAAKHRLIHQAIHRIRRAAPEGPAAVQSWPDPGAGRGNRRMFALSPAAMVWARETLRVTFTKANA